MSEHAGVTQEIREIVHKFFAAYICSATWHTDNCNRAAQRLADYADKVRLDEARYIRDEHLDSGGWELVDKDKFDAHIAKLERSVNQQ